MDVKERNLVGCGEKNIVDMADMDEENFAVSNSSASDAAFDTVIGSIEDIIMEEEFQQLQQSFMEKHYLEFDNSEENKLSYTLIFNEYVDLLEKHLEEQLMERIPGFNMSTFIGLLVMAIMFQMDKIMRKDADCSFKNVWKVDQPGNKYHKADVPCDIFDMLQSFTDFTVFKEMFLDYRAGKEGRGLDLSQGLIVTSLSSA